MNDLSFSTIFLHGILLSIGMGVIILGGMSLNPRIMLSDYPPQIKAQVPPMTSEDKRQQKILGIFFWGFALAIFFYSSSQLAARSGGQLSFGAAFLNSYLVFQISNLFDFLVLDYLILTVLHPKFLLIPEVNASMLAGTTRFHFIGFLKGIVIGVVLAAIIAIISIIIW